MDMCYFINIMGSIMHYHIITRESEMDTRPSSGSGVISRSRDGGIYRDGPIRNCINDPVPRCDVARYNGWIEFCLILKIITKIKL